MTVQLANKLVKYLSNRDFRFSVNRSYGLLNNMPDEEYLARMFKAVLGYSLNLDDPKTFNEKLQWLKLHDRNPLYTTLVDKYEVKQWVAERVGSDCVIPTYGVWNSFDDIDFSVLPERFVLKCTHDSGSVALCESKATFDYEAARKKLSEALKHNFYYTFREWPYKDVQPRIIAEEYLANDASTNDLMDYKVLCFSGVPKIVEVHKARFANHTQDWYDIDWNKLSISQPDMPSSKEADPRPAFIDKILEQSALLSEGMTHVRVDWYYTNGKLYFGEMTFYDGAGFECFEDYRNDLYLGSLIDLNEPVA